MLVLALCLLRFSSNAFADKNKAKDKVKIPDWVQQAAADPLPSYTATTRAVVLLDSEVVTVKPDGTAVVHEQRVVKILRNEGRGDATVAVSNDVDQKLNYIHAWSIGPDGHYYAVNADEFVTTGDEEEGFLYNSVQWTRALPSAADPGAVVAYEYEQRERPYVNEEDWTFQEQVPVRKAVFEIDLPPGWKFYAGWLHHPPDAPDELGSGRLRWEVNDVPPINTEDVPQVPAGEALAGRMAVHYANGQLPDPSMRWAAIGEWYETLSSSQASVTPEITAKAQELTAGESDFTAKLESITEYMRQKIRYVGIEIGIGGYRPHAAAEVFRNQYGDCKDKATLLKTMLGAVGIDATWVLVDSRRGVVDPHLPSIYGDHMIAAIAIPAGYDNPALQAVVTNDEGKRYLVFDPTDPFTPVGQLNADLQGSYGVLVNGKQSQVVQLPMLSATINLLDRTAKFDLSADGALSGSVTETRSGDEAWLPRGHFTEESAKDQKERMERRLQQDFSGFTLASYSAENVRELQKPFVLQYSISVPDYGRSQGSLMLVRPRVLGSMSMALDDKPRTYPIDLGTTRTERDDFELRLPPDYVVDETPDPVSIKTSFGSYRSKVQVEGSLLRYSSELVLNKLELEASQYTELRDFMAKVRADEDSVVVLKKK